MQSFYILIALFLVLSVGAQQNLNVRLLNLLDNLFSKSKNHNSLSSTTSLGNNLIESLFLKNKDDVSLSLYTPDSTRLHITNVQSKDFKNIAPYKFIVHGWTESPSKPYFKAMTSAYLKRGNYNIVHVNWSIPASALDYTVAVRNTLHAGTILGKLIVQICEVSSTMLEDIHILGHSLGAHVAGAAGKEVFKITRRKVGRITGLDPAKPLFEGVLGVVSQRLDRNDATMVDIVHTDGGVFGYNDPHGTVDFFPNGGVPVQPGCRFFKWIGGIPNKETLSEEAFCSHAKSYAYYIESINSKDIVSIKCDSWMHFENNMCQKNDRIVFGEDIPSDAAGKYYFKINSNLSYSM